MNSPLSNKTSRVFFHGVAQATVLIVRKHSVAY
jgi:hypothetical protein